MVVPLHRLYVGTIGEGLFRSLDGGLTFMRACNGMFSECHVRALAVHPHHPEILYLGSELGLFRSSDGAENWARIESPLNGRQIWSILIHPRRPDLLLVGTCPAALFRSDDGGRTWTEAAVRIAQECPRILWNRVTTLRADPEQTDTLWAGVEIDGLFRSRDAGKSWEAVGSGLSSRDIHDLAFVPGNGRARRLLAATNNDLNLSTDEGETWKPLGAGQHLPWGYFRALTRPLGQAEVVLAGHGDFPPGSAGLVARSTDGGDTWKPTIMPQWANSTIWNFASHAADLALLYASSVSGEVYRSTDGGVHWDKLAREFGEIRALAWTP